MVVVFSVLVLVSGFFAFSSIGVSFSDLSNIQYNNKSLANGTSKTYTLNNFSQVEFKTFGNLSLVKSDKNELKIESDKDYIDKLQPSQIGKTIYIDSPKLNIKFWQKPNEVMYTLYYNGQLEKIDVRGSGDITAFDVASSDLKLSVFGSGDITVRQAKIETLGVLIAGSGNIKLDGECKRSDVEISGSGDVVAGDMKCAEGSAVVKGSGNSLVNISDKLKASVFGSGNIDYAGQPRIDKETKGSGEIRQIQQ